MGMGKTAWVCCFLKLLFEKGEMANRSILIVIDPMLVSAWMDQIKMWLIDFNVISWNQVFGSSGEKQDLSELYSSLNLKIDEIKNGIIIIMSHHKF